MADEGDRSGSLARSIGVYLLPGLLGIAGIGGLVATQVHGGSDEGGGARHEGGARVDCDADPELLCPLEEYALDWRSARLPTDACDDDPDVTCRIDPHRVDPGVDFLVATLPDPNDSPLDYAFDRFFDAIRRGLEAEGYLFDRSWLPWSPSTDRPAPLEKEARRYVDLYEQQLAGGKPGAARPQLFRPGVALFKRAGEGGRARLLIVFLVGETATAGVHKEALRNALRAMHLPEDQPATVRVLGPTFSGSIASLAETLRAFAAARKDTTIQVVSGTATVRDDKRALEQALAGVTKDAQFNATVLPDDIVMGHAFRYLYAHGFGPDDVAILSESNTSYGSAAAAVKACAGERCERTFEPKLHLTFPMHISQLRNAHEHDRHVANAASEFPHRLLDLSLDDGAAARDVVLPMSDTTTYSIELELANTLSIIANRHVAWVVIAASDTKDVIFLAEQIHRYCPGVRTITANADVLYLHDQLPFLHGMLVATSYPLVPMNQSWSMPFEGGWNTASFPSDTAEGIYNATLFLVGGKAVPVEYGPPLPDELDDATMPAAWLTAVGNGELWPLSVEKAPADDRFVARLAFAHDHPGGNRLLAAARARPIDAPIGFRVVLFLLACVVLWIAGAVLLGLRGGELADERSARFWFGRFWERLVRSCAPPDDEPVRIQRLSVLLLLAPLFVVQLAALRAHCATALHDAGGAFDLGGLSFLDGFLVLLGAATVALAAAALFAVAAQLLAPSLIGTPGERWLIRLSLIEGAALAVVYVAITVAGKRGVTDLFDDLRLVHLGSGLSLLVPTLLVCAALSLCAMCTLNGVQTRLRLGGARSAARSELGTVERALDRLDDFLGLRTAPTAALLTLVALFAIGLVAPSIHYAPFRDGWPFLLHVGLSVLSLFALALITRAFGLWLDLQRFLDQFIEQVVRWKPPAVERPALESLAAGSDEPSEVRRIPTPPSAPPALVPHLPAIKALRFHANELLTCTTLAVLALVAAASCYPFSLERALVVIIWMLTLALVLASALLLVQMNRHPVMSFIAGTPAGLSFDRGFLWSIFVHAALPLLGLAATHSPAVGGFVSSWLEPLLRVLRH